MAWRDPGDLVAGTVLVIDAPGHAHDRIGALLEAMRRAQATHLPVEAPGVAPGQRVRVVPLCGLLLETVDRARLPGNPSALEDDLLQFMLERLGARGEEWSLDFCARMAVVRGDDRVQGVFDEAVGAAPGGVTTP